jgi:hypothetical protein
MANKKPNQTKIFPRHQIAQALLKHFPYCPSEHRHLILGKMAEKNWTRKTSLTRAISIVVHNHIRHHLTDYDELLRKKGLMRDEARLIVKPEVDDWFDYWHTGNDASKPEPK